MNFLFLLLPSLWVLACLPFCYYVCTVLALSQEHRSHSLHFPPHPSPIQGHPTLELSIFSSLLVGSYQSVNILLILFLKMIKKVPFNSTYFFCNCPFFSALLYSKIPRISVLFSPSPAYFPPLLKTH